MTRTISLIAAVSLIGLPLEALGQNQIAPTQRTAPAQAPDGWYRGYVYYMFVTDFGAAHVGFDPDPATQGFQCKDGGGATLEPDHATEYTIAEALWIKGQMYKLFSDALASNGQIAAHLEQRISPFGEPVCFVTAAQQWAGRTTANPSAQNPSQTNGPGPSAGLYGALALGDNLGGFVTTNYSTQSEATRDALAGCSNRDSGCVARQAG